MEHYTQFLGRHPVWSNTAIAASHPVTINHGQPTYNQKSWWPQGKTTRHQICNCHENKSSARYKTLPIRRNFCPECGHFKNDKQNELDYEWDPIDDPLKGKPIAGDVVEMWHDMRGVAYDENHKEYKSLTDKQKIVGKLRTLGAKGHIAESYDENLHTRQRETSVPDGPAFERARERGNDLQQQMLDKRREVRLQEEGSDGRQSS